MKNQNLYKLSWYLALAVGWIFISSCTGVVNAEPGKSQVGGITGNVFLDENANAIFEECDCDCELEDVSVRLYKDRCAGLVIQKVKTGSDGSFLFENLEPGAYCVMPEPKLICEGYQATTSITQIVEVKAGEVVNAGLFGFDHYIDTDP